MLQDSQHLPIIIRDDTPRLMPRDIVVRLTEIKNLFQACMLTFYPEFEAQTSHGYEVVFILDLSNSMKGKALEEARKVLLLALHHLPSTCTFNVVTFGTCE